MLTSSTRFQDSLARNTNASAEDPSSTISARGSAEYNHQSKAGSSPRARTPRASFNPRRRSTRPTAEAPNQYNNGNAAHPTTTSVACIRPRMMNSAKQRMHSKLCYVSNPRSHRQWLLGRASRARPAAGPEQERQERPSIRAAEVQDPPRQHPTNTTTAMPRIQPLPEWPAYDRA